MKAMAPSQAFRMIAEAASLGVSVSPKVTAPVDILVRNVTAKTALDAICESIGCRWTISDNVISVMPRGDGYFTGSATFGDARSVQARLSMDRLQAALKQRLPAGMTFEDSPLADVSARLSDALDLKVELISDDPHLRTLTADFSNQTLIEAIKRVFPPGDRAYSWRIAMSPSGTDAKSPSFMLGFKVDAKKK